MVLELVIEEYIKAFVAKVVEDEVGHWLLDILMLARYFIEKISPSCGRCIIYNPRSKKTLRLLYHAKMLHL